MVREKRVRSGGFYVRNPRTVINEPRGPLLQQMRQDRIQRTKRVWTRQQPQRALATKAQSTAENSHEDTSQGNVNRTYWCRSTDTL